MISTNSRLVALLVIAGVTMGACARRPPPLHPPPVASQPPATETRTGSTAPDPPSVLLPTLDVRIEPPSIKRGASALLIWQAQHSDQVTINHNIGVVDTSGKIKFFPDETTTYQVVAEGAGGRAERTVTVEVAAGSAGDISERDLLQRSIEEQFEHSIKPVFFSFDRAILSAEAKADLDSNIGWLQRGENSHLRFVLEGHCDERGSEEYNLALGDLRAQVVRGYLIERGVDPSRIAAISLGEERPFDSRRTEEAWTLNRRVQFVLVKEG